MSLQNECSAKRLCFTAGRTFNVPGAHTPCLLGHGSPLKAAVYGCEHPLLATVNTLIWHQSASSCRSCRSHSWGPTSRPPCGSCTVTVLKTHTKASTINSKLEPLPTTDLELLIYAPPAGHCLEMGCLGNLRNL